MKWSTKIGRFAGIDVFVHLTFLFLVAWIALLHWQQGQSLAAVLAGVFFILAIFLCVVLHEFGHALMARRYGIQTRDIILLPIGGVARLERMPTQPVQELWVALAGPAVNLVIAVLLYAWVWATASWEPLSGLTVTTGPFLERLMAVNVFMIVFNMIPAFPMDGGRVLRALMATRLEYSRATRIAASIGKGVALFFGAAGLFYSPFLILIAVFVWITAGQEAAMARMKSSIGDVPVQRAMIRDFKTLSFYDNLSRAVELSLTGTQRDFPVVKDGILQGILRQSDLFKALSEKGAHASVASATQKDVTTIDDTDTLETVVNKLNDCRCHALPVTRRGKLVGLVTSENLGVFLQLRATAAG